VSLSRRRPSFAALFSADDGGSLRLISQRVDVLFWRSSRRAPKSPNQAGRSFKRARSRQGSTVRCTPKCEMKDAANSGGLFFRFAHRPGRDRRPRQFIAGNATEHALAGLLAQSGELFLKLGCPATLGARNLILRIERHAGPHSAATPTHHLMYWFLAECSAQRFARTAKIPNRATLNYKGGRQGSKQARIKTSRSVKRPPTEAASLSGAFPPSTVD
jgi:hypothetical protein